MQRCYVWDPKNLTINLNASQAMLRQVFLFQTEEREVWQIAEDGLKPAMLRHDLSHARVFELIDVKRQHRNVLRRSRRSDRVKNRL